MSAEEEAELALAREALRAAYDVLKGLAELEGQARLRLVLEAFVAAVAAVRAGEETYRAAHPEASGLYVEVGHVIASALVALSHDAEPDERHVHPYTEMARPYLDFARACLLLEYVAEADMLVTQVEEDCVRDLWAGDALELLRVLGRDEE